MNDTKKASERGGFGSKLGFILAAAGSAVGLGNIWRFPYLAAKYGGGVFLLIYIIFAVTFGFTLMLTEIAIGRSTGKSVIGAYKAVDKRFSFLGVLAAAIPALILPYYCVIGGWVLKYMTVFITNSGAEAAKAEYAGASPDVKLSFFEHFIGQLVQPSVFFIIFVLLTSVAVFIGVEKGIELVSKFLMPVLLILIVGIAIYTLTLDGAGEGLKYYLLPNTKDFTFSKLMRTIAAACGQLFYSMSIAMGIMVTYGSYMRKEDSLENSVRQIEIFDTAVAFLAGLIIVPAVFVFSGGDSSALNAGPGLMFITLPKVFSEMPAGGIIGSAFFILVALAALTSSISLMETVVAVVMEKFRLSRAKSCCIVIALTLALGMLSVLGYSSWSDVKIFGMQILDLFDFTTNNLMMPVLAFLTCILVGYIAKTKYIEEEVMYGEKRFRSKLLYSVMIKAVCPVCMIMILITPFVTEI
ncbi:sodium-dependent transporter [Ruminococcus sp.]|uniref:sodium-dependent transporter n=1 Tax=Ruminococcus sp. TaxID=41978 RepID=UPI0025EE2615|nr:sodium-dependent transporter [Ruminococcus sp.]MCR4639460.1 sodium-dependent transporter [Ruminococcus sp.]